MSTWKKVLTAADITALGSGSIITGDERTKLAGIEISADVTDATTVAAAGAFMATSVGTFGATLVDDETQGDARTTLGLGTAATTAATAYATAAQGTLAANALPKSGGAMTGAITTNSTFDGVDVGARDAVLTSTTTVASAALPKSGGAMTGAITTNSTFDGVDIAARDGVLTSTTTVANAALPKAGGTMTGALTLNAAPTSNLHAATKLYVDGNVVSKTNLAAVLATYDSTDTLNIGDAGNDTTVIIRGTLQVDGTTTTVNSSTLTVDDHIITAASGSGDAATADTAGLEIDTGNATQLPFLGFVDGAGLTEMVVKAEGNTTAFPIAIMEFGATEDTAPPGDAGGIGSFHFNTTDAALYIRTA